MNLITENNQTHLVPQTDLTRKTTDRQRLALIDLLPQVSTESVMLDLRAVKTIDAAGLALIFNLAASCTQRQIALELMISEPFPVLERIHLERLIPIRQERCQAAAHG